MATKRVTVRQPNMATNSDKFWTRVHRGAPEDCWPWLGARNAGGYGKVRSPQRRSDNIGAHRLALVFSGVDVPSDRLVLHSCDNPPCCNPAHLRVGTYSENARDRRDRTTKILDAAAVRRIRELLAAGHVQQRIAEEYGISQQTVSLIKHRATWEDA